MHDEARAAVELAVFLATLRPWQREWLLELMRRMGGEAERLSKAATAMLR